MKAKLSMLVIFAMFVALPAASETIEISGTWSGNWVTQGGVWNAVTVQFVQQDSGKLSGKFLTPVQMDIRKVSFDPKTGKLLLEAVDETSGTNYKLDGKLQGTELKGTLSANEMAGELLLIKWTYVPR